MFPNRSSLLHRASIVLVVILLLAVAGSPGFGSSAFQTSTAVAEAQSDWAMYGHDPQRTSYDPDEKSINGDNVGQLEQAWQDNIGIGDSTVPAFSAPSVAGGLVYIASSVSTGNNLFALDAATGVPRWNAFIGFSPGECFGVGIGSTPAVGDGVVTIGGGDGAYYGLNAANGTQLWRDPLNEGPSAFAWVSPLVANGRAYLGIASDCDNPSVRGLIYSVDLSTGTRVANQYLVPEDRAGAGIWNSAALSADGNTLFATTGEDFEGYDGENTRALLAMDADSLQIMAANRQGDPNKDQDWATTPLVFHDASGRQMVGAGHKNGTFYAYYQDAIAAGPAWSWNPGPSVGLLPAYDPTAGTGGLLFIGSKQHLYAINASDGTALWVSEPVGEMHGNFAAANGLLFVNGGGNLVILDEATGTILRTIEPPGHGPGLSGPAISNGTVYWMSGAYINAWHLPAGTPCPGCASPTPTPAGPGNPLDPSPADSPPGVPNIHCAHSTDCRGWARKYRNNANQPPTNTTYSRHVRRT